MGNSTNNTKTSRSLEGFCSAAITLALIILAFMCTTMCTAQDSIYVTGMDSLFYDSAKTYLQPDLLDEYWDTETIHVKGVDIKTLPDTIEVPLIDSAHRFCFPCEGAVRSKFHYRGSHAHKGVDIPLCVGDDVCSAFDGVVRIAKCSRYSGGYGNLVVIRHYNGLETYYGHLSRCLVQVGDTVSAGELIGYGGSTGRSTGPHLHFETRYLGKAFDPERIFDFHKGTLRSDTIFLKKHYFSCHSHYGMTDEQSLAAFLNPPRLTPAIKYYKVRKGDTLTRIARRERTTVTHLCQLNNMKSTKVIRVGQRLRVK